MRDLESFDDQNHGSQSNRKVLLIECKTALSPSSLPGLDFALNPYFGCSHACIYCYAPYVFHQTKQDWGSSVKVKINIPKAIASEAAKRRGVVGVGTVTDPYQPLEEEFKLTRRCLEELLKFNLPVSILTKSPLVARDIDVLSRFKKAEVGMTITTQFDGLAALFEPRAPPPSARLDAVKKLVEAGIDTYVMIGPVIPDITDVDLDDFFQKIASTKVKRMIIDKLRLRPGMLSKIRILELMKDEDRWNSFCEKASSASYYAELFQQIDLLCEKHGMKCSQAF